MRTMMKSIRTMSLSTILKMLPQKMRIFFPGTQMRFSKKTSSFPPMRKSSLATKK